jgi:acyl-coenzyme A thioesterase PaaI-like protein
MFSNTMTKLRDDMHRDCFFRSNELCTDNEFDDQGNLRSRFFCDERFQGYTGRMHGGILSALIDSAMTRCLFGHGIAAYTVRLNLKYSHPVEIGKQAEIRVSIAEKRSTIIKLTASIYQDEKNKISANAVFWKIGEEQAR